MTADLFRIRDHVDDFDAVVADIRARSDAARQRLRMVGDIAYGPGPGERLDLFLPEHSTKPAPVHLFIHGGYWRMFSKDDYAAVAETVTAAGAIAVIIDYALMPSVRMARIVEQVCMARRWIASNIADHGGDPARLTVTGHSAGAHLATFLFEREGSGIRAAWLLGGLYDLKPLQNSFLKAEIAITDAEVAAFTPMDHRHDPATVVDILVGARETPPFHEQAAAFRDRLQGQGLLVNLTTLSDRHHMDSVRDLAIPGSEASRSLAAMIGRV